MLLNAFFNPYLKNVLAVPNRIFIASHETDKNINRTTIENIGIWKTPASKAPASGSNIQITVLLNAHRTNPAGIEYTSGYRFHSHFKPEITKPSRIFIHSYIFFKSCFIKIYFNSLIMSPIPEKIIKKITPAIDK